jgi:hypothetical protein
MKTKLLKRIFLRVIPAFVAIVIAVPVALDGWRRQL